MKCVACGYEMEGAPGSTCPECGYSAQAAARANWVSAARFGRTAWIMLGVVVLGQSAFLVAIGASGDPFATPFLFLFVAGVVLLSSLFGVWILIVRTGRQSSGAERLFVEISPWACLLGWVGASACLIVI